MYKKLLTALLAAVITSTVSCAIVSSAQTDDTAKVLLTEKDAKEYYKDYVLGDDGELDPEYVEMGYAEGQCYWETHNYNDSIEIFWSDNYLDLDPDWKFCSDQKAAGDTELIVYKKQANGKWKGTKLNEENHRDDLEFPWLYEDKNVEPATKYTYKIVSRYENYPFVRLAVKFDTMTAPDNIRLTGQTSKTSVRLNWNKVKCDGYIIEEAAEENGGLFEEIMRVDKDTTTVKLKNREPGKVYRFRVEPYVTLKNTMEYNYIKDENIFKWEKCDKEYVSYSNDLTLATKLYDDETLGDCGQTGSAENKDLIKWNTATDKNSITVTWDESGLLFPSDLMELPEVRKSGLEQIVCVQMPDGKWKKSKDLDYNKEGNLVYTVKGLKPHTKYNVKIISRLKAYPNVRKTVKFATMTTPEPVKITGHSSKHSVRLNWNKVDCDGYKMQSNDYFNPDQWGTTLLVGKSKTTAKKTYDYNLFYPLDYRVCAYSKLYDTYVYDRYSDKWKKGSKVYLALSNTVKLKLKK